MTDLLVSCQIETSPGVFLELEDLTNGYEMEASAFNDRTEGMKQRTIGEDMPWLRGEIVTASGPSNVVENLAVWVEGPDHYTFDFRVNVLRLTVRQRTYKIKRQIGNSLETWTCFPPANFRVATQKEYLIATTGTVIVPVPRLPDALLEEVTL